MWAAGRPVAERVLGLSALNSIYETVTSDISEANFIKKLFDLMHVRTEVPDENLARIPTTGPLVVVANHPFGGIEGLVLAQILQRVRPDVKIFANYLLRVMPDFHDLFFYVDPFGTPDSFRRNLASLRAATRWVRNGGTLGVFPAGEVSHLQLNRGCITDPNWSDTIARLIQNTGASVLPVFFEGCNSRLFQMAGLIHPRLRTVLLPREFLKRSHGTISVRIGHSITPARVRQFVHPKDLTAYLRVRTYILKGRETPETRRSALLPSIHRRTDRPLVEAESPDIIRCEIESLPANQLLLTSNAFSVVWARADQIPHALREIGRLRELTFRKVGEGTGREIDLDRFDDYYRHLIVWNRERNHIVGCYRIGPTDEIVQKFGLDGLYTSTLFRYQPALMTQMGPSLEMGRSFVVAEYQRSYSSLMLLWKGIGRYVVAHPRYRILFGAVSISNDYHTTTKQILMNFLRMHNYMEDYARLVHPRNPPRHTHRMDYDQRLVTTTVHDLDQVDELIREIELDAKNIPVLLRQYLKLNAKLLGFNVDTDFGDVLDGLMMVDLTQVDRPVLNRYLGDQGSEQFLRHHGF